MHDRDETSSQSDKDLEYFAGHIVRKCTDIRVHASR